LAIIFLNASNQLYPLSPTCPSDHSNWPGRR